MAHKKAGGSSRNGQIPIQKDSVLSCLGGKKRKLEV